MFQELRRGERGQHTVQHAGLQGFQAANSEAEVRLSFLPPVIPKRQNSTGQQVRAPARIPESGSLHEATK